MPASIARLIAFDTTSRHSNLALIEWVEAFLADLPVHAGAVDMAMSLKRKEAEGQFDLFGGFGGVGKGQVEVVDLGGGGVVDDHGGLLSVGPQRASAGSAV